MLSIHPCHICGISVVGDHGNPTLVRCIDHATINTYTRSAELMIKRLFLPLPSPPSSPPSPSPSFSPFSPYLPIRPALQVPWPTYALDSSRPNPFSRSRWHSDSHWDSPYLPSPPSSSNVHEQRQSSNSFGRNPVTQHSHSHSSSLDSPPSSSNVHNRQEFWQFHKLQDSHSHSSSLNSPPSSSNVNNCQEFEQLDAWQPVSSHEPLQPPATTTPTRICQASTAHYSPQSQQGLSPLPSSTRTPTSAQVGPSPPSGLEDIKVVEIVLHNGVKISFVTVSVNGALWNVIALSSSTSTKVLIMIAMMTAIFAIVLHSLASFQLYVLESAHHTKRHLMLLVAFSAVSLLATLFVLPAHSWSQTECDPNCWVERTLVSTVMIGGFASLMIGGWRMRGGNGRSVA